MRDAASLLGRHWPRVLVTHSMPLHTAPLDAHRLVIPAVRSIVARVYAHDALPLLYRTMGGALPADANPFLTTAPPLPGVPANDSVIGSPARRLARRYPAMGLADSWQGVVTPGQALIVPAGAAVAWHAVDDPEATVVDDAGNDASPAVVVEWCFIDAAAVPKLRSAASLRALTSPVHRGLLDALSSQALDTTMVRLPPLRASLDVLTAWPRLKPEAVAASGDSISHRFDGLLQSGDGGDTGGSEGGLDQVEAEASTQAGPQGGLGDGGASGAPGTEGTGESSAEADPETTPLLEEPPQQEAGETEAAFRRRTRVWKRTQTASKAGGAPSTAPGRGADRKRKLRAWQDIRRWQHRIRQLLAPAPEDLHVPAASRRSAVVAFRVPVTRRSGNEGAVGAAGQAKLVPLAREFVLVWTETGAPPSASTARRRISVAPHGNAPSDDPEEAGVAAQAGPGDAAAGRQRSDRAGSRSLSAAERRAAARRNRQRKAAAAAAASDVPEGGARSDQEAAVGAGAAEPEPLPQRAAPGGKGTVEAILDDASAEEAAFLRSSPEVVEALAALRRVQAVGPGDLASSASLREHSAHIQAEIGAGAVASLADIGLELRQVAQGHAEARMLASSLADFHVLGATRVSLAGDFLLRDGSAADVGASLIRDGTEADIVSQLQASQDGEQSAQPSITALPCNKVLSDSDKADPFADPDPHAAARRTLPPEMLTDPTMVCARVYGLRPASSYTFRAAAVSEASPVSFFSEPSAPARTRSLTLPGTMLPPVVAEESSSSATLSLSLPTDDGGMPVMGVLVVRLDSPTSQLANEVLLAPASKVVVRGLRPAHTYRFAVAAVTAMGFGQISPLSDEASTPDLGFAFAAGGRPGAALTVRGVGSGAESLVTPSELEAAQAVKSLELDSATDEFGKAFRNLGAHGRVIFAAHVAVRQLLREGYHVDVGAFLQRSGLAHASEVLHKAAAAEHSEQQRAAARLTAGHDLAPDSGGPAVPGTTAPSRAAIEALRHTAAAAQGHHPHGDVIFGNEEPLAPRVRDLLEMPCQGAVVLLSDSAQLIRLQREDGFERDWTIAGWASHWSPRAFDVHAEVVVSNPPTGAGGHDAAVPTALNAHAFRGRIVVFTRGAIPLAVKVRIAASHGALGAVIVDTSRRCSDESFGQVCVPGAAKAANEGWAALDPARMWDNARIPALIVGSDAGAYLMSLASH
ncbi:hypothetical protein FNF31_04180 [Cafeteria roenbergensis]|uniref:Fibronectin type-III domain-containing protein n=1 Tax=Cafeteria roenbergensis TaxID=33653 RepID=A0A5A8D6R5_CAFRO|nr:hypothetical protein FNF31_04180 [Cafeteria roenbergensis]